MKPWTAAHLAFLVLHHLPELVQTHFHWVNVAIQLFHPLLLPSPPAFSLPQHLGLSQWACSSNFPRKHFFKCIYFNQLDHTIRKRSESDNKLMNLGYSIVWPTCSFVCFYCCCSCYLCYLFTPSRRELTSNLTS